MLKGKKRQNTKRGNFFSRMCKRHKQQLTAALVIGLAGVGTVVWTMAGNDIPGRANEVVFQVETKTADLIGRRDTGDTVAYNQPEFDMRLMGDGTLLCSDESNVNYKVGELPGNSIKSVYNEVMGMGLFNQPDDSVSLPEQAVVSDFTRVVIGNITHGPHTFTNYRSQKPDKALQKTAERLLRVCDRLPENAERINQDDLEPVKMSKSDRSILQRIASAMPWQQQSVFASHKAQHDPKGGGTDDSGSDGGDTTTTSSGLTFNGRLDKKPTHSHSFSTASDTNGVTVSVETSKSATLLVELLDANNSLVDSTSAATPFTMDAAVSANSSYTLRVNLESTNEKGKIDYTATVSLLGTEVKDDTGSGGGGTTDGGSGSTTGTVRTDWSQDQYSRINNLRASKGLNQLGRDSCLDQIALDWSRYMAENPDQNPNDGRIWHNPNKGAQVDAQCNNLYWDMIAENVGCCGSSSESLFQAFVDSPGHYDNLVNSNLELVGVGAYQGGEGDYVYVTHLFFSGTGSPNTIDAAQCTGISTSKSVVAPGESFTATVHVKNVGSTVTWQLGSAPSEWLLGSSNPRNTTKWNRSRVVKSGSVAPGQTVTFKDFTVTASSNLSDGNHTFSWEMLREGYYWLGNACSTTITVDTPQAADTTAPSVNISSPSGSTTLTSGTHRVSGSAYDNVSLSYVTLSVDGGSAYAVNGTTSWYRDVSLSAGTHTLTATAVDSSGNRRSDSVTVSVQDPTSGGGGGSDDGGSTTTSDRLSSGQTLYRGESIYSSDGGAQLVLQESDGHLVLYGPSGARWWNGVTGGAKLAMQSDGNLVVYNSSGNAIWYSGTWGHSGQGVFLKVQNDDRVGLYTSSGTNIWIKP